MSALIICPILDRHSRMEDGTIMHRRTMRARAPNSVRKQITCLALGTRKSMETGAIVSCAVQGYRTLLNMKL